MYSTHRYLLDLMLMIEKAGKSFNKSTNQSSLNINELEISICPKTACDKDHGVFTIEEYNYLCKIFVSRH